MKFLVDECVDHRVVDWLRLHDHDVVAIVETSSGIPDEQVLHKAFSENRILVTMDKDSATLFLEVIELMRELFCFVC